MFGYKGSELMPVGDRNERQQVTLQNSRSRMLRCSGAPGDQLDQGK